MKTLGNKIKRGIVGKLREFRNWATQNWLHYTISKNVFFLFFIPFIYLVAEASTAIGIPELGLLSLLILLPIPLFILLDSKRLSVVENNPAEFIKAEGAEKFFDALSWTLFPLSLISLVVMANVERIGNGATPSLPTVWLFLFFTWTGSLAGLELSSLEASNLIGIIKKRFVPKSRWHLFEFYPSENARARARFVVVSDYLSRNPTKSGRKFRLFYQGLRIYNSHLKDAFGFVLREPKRFYCEARLFTYSKDNVGNIKKGLESLTELMKDENREPFEIVKSLKGMLNEPDSFKEVCAEIDADPQRIRKWFSIHSDSIIGIVGIILAIVELVLFFSVFH